MSSAEVGPKIPLEPENFPHLTSFEWDALLRLASQVGDVVVKTLLRNGAPESHRYAAHEFMARELSDARAASAARSTPASDKPRGLKLEVSSYTGDSGTPLHRWFCEVEVAMQARQVSDAKMQVAFVMSKLSGRAKSWAFGRLLSDRECFPDLHALKSALQQTFEPAQSEFRLRAKFLSVRQGSLELHDYIQKVRYLSSCIVEHPVDMVTQVTTFMTGLRDGPVKTQMYREYPDTLEGAFEVALREDFNAKQDRSSSKIRPAISGGGPEPMDLSVAQVNSRPQFGNARGAGSNDRVCHRCQKRGHYARECRASAPVATGARRFANDSGRSARGGPKNERDQ